MRQTVRRCLLLLLLLFVSPVAAQSSTPVFFPLVSSAGEPPPPPTPTPAPVPVFEELPPWTTTVPLYGAVHPISVADKYGDIWRLDYPLGSESGAYLYRGVLGGPLVEIGGPFSVARGGMVVGCDGKLYLLLYADDSRYIQRVLRVNLYPGPPYPTSCTPRGKQLERGERGWEVVD